MKHLLILSTLLVFAISSKAQLIIQNGATLFGNANSVIAVQNGNVVNNGTIDMGNAGAALRLNGNTAASISGTGTTTVNLLEVDKPATNITLLHSINVNGRVNFINGQLNLDKKVIYLTSNATLQNETENNRAFTTDTGYIQISNTINNQTNVNLGNLGAIISTPNNLGLVTVRRGHKPQILQGAIGSISRYYDIYPTNNSFTNNSLVFNYFDAELGIHSESGLNLYKSADTGITFTNQLKDAINTTQNLITKNNIGFSRWTAANSAILPLKLINYNAQLVNNTVVNKWITTNEQNVNRYEVERSSTGYSFAYVGDVKAANNIANNYTFTDVAPLPDISYYRLKMIDNNGLFSYSNVVKISRDNNTPKINAWPNPATNYLTIYSPTTEKFVAYDIGGKQVHNGIFIAGNNTLYVKNWAAGVYTISTNTNGTIRFVKE
jgi:hypothetical protein